MILVDGDVSSVEQSVDIAAQRQAVRYEIRSTESKRMNVRRLEHWKRVLLSDRASPAVSIKHLNAKDSLSQPGKVKGWGTITIPDCKGFGIGLSNARLPYSQSLAGGKVVCRSNLSSDMPIGRSLHPLIRRKEVSLCDKTATDLPGGIRLNASYKLDSAQPIAQGG